MHPERQVIDWLTWFDKVTFNTPLGSLEVFMLANTALIGLTPLYVKPEYAPPWVRRLQPYHVWFAVVVLVPVALVNGVTFTHQLIEMLVGETSSPFVFTLSAFIFAACLFGLRQGARILYGILEIIVGTVALSPAWPRATSDRELVQHCLVIAGGIYIIIRGLSNAQDGWKARKDKRALAETPPPLTGPEPGSA